MAVSPVRPPLPSRIGCNKGRADNFLFLWLVESRGPENELTEICQLLFNPAGKTTTQGICFILAH
jgi:hypothetical protein